jgi:hypothetical protein
MAAIVLVVVGCSDHSGNPQLAPNSTTITSKAGGNLSGEWESSDYECPAGIKHSERLRITQDGTRISAVKTAGDDCVPTGHESFSGTVVGTSGMVRLWTATPGGQPTLGADNVNLVIQDANTFSLTCPATLSASNCNIKLTRATT